MAFYDSHAHLTSEVLYSDIEGVLKRSHENKIGKVINICTDKLTLERGLALAEKEPLILNAGATPPHDVEKEGELLFPHFEEAANSKKLVAIGETGLDYYYEHSNRKIQQTFLIRYFELAKKTKLPVIIHCREAFEDLFALAKEHYPKGKLLLHCFTGTLEEAEKALERNYYISFSGIITFKKSASLRDIVKEVPLKSLLIETDAPYLAPQTKRGKTNEPSFIVETAQLIANIKGLSLEEVESITFENAHAFFEFARNIG